MKLWQKVFLTTLALLVLTTNGLSLLFLRSSQNELWQRERRRAATQQQYMASLIKTGVVSQRLQSGQICLGPDAADQAALEVMERQAPDEYLTASQLYRSGRSVSADETGLCRGSGLAGSEYTDPALTYGQVFRREAQLFFALNAPLLLEQTDYRLICVFDVTDLDRHLQRQTTNALALSGAASLLSAAVLLVIVRALLRPLSTLSRASRHIAQGNYAERVNLGGSDELASLAQDMNRMAQAVQSRVEQLEQAADDQKAFIANMAHEMKTPLTSILGFADLLYLQKDVPVKRRMEYAGIIVEETKRMRSLSGKLMELLNVGSQNLVFTPEPLDALVAEVAAAMQPVLAGAGITLQQACEPGLTVLADRELFKSLLFNFIDNARKASPQGSTIKLLGHVQQGEAELLVRDYGQGIPEKELEKIRQPFYMVDKSRSRKAGGAGLGLALCEEIARIHGARFSIDSRVGEGTLITLRLPLAGAEPSAGEVQP